MATRVGHLEGQAGRTRCERLLRFLSIGLAVLLSCFAVHSGAARAQEAKEKGAKNEPAQAKDADAQPERVVEGALVRLPLPITDSVDKRFRRTVGGLLQRIPLGGPRPILIIEFDNGQSKDGAGSDFHSANRLAEFLIGDELKRLNTVAYLPETVKGHAVLAAMACEEIIMAPEADIGEAGIDEPEKAQFRRATYERIANARKTIPAAIALGMLDKDLQVLKVVTDVGTEFILSDELDALKRKRQVLETQPIDKRPGLFSGREARQELEFVRRLAKSREQLAELLALPDRVLRESPLLAGELVAVQVTIRGEINSGLTGQVMRTIDEQVKQGSANFVCVRIESRGGNPIESQQLANYLAALDPAKVRTVAYIESEAHGDAALIALACDEILMHPDAVLGGQGVYVMEDGEEITQAVRAYRKGVAEVKGRSWSLGAAMIDPGLKVYRFDNKINGLTEYWSDEEAEGPQGPNAQPRDLDAWAKGPLVTSDGGPLRVTGERAEELGIVTRTVNNFGELKSHYGLEDDPALVDPGWVDHLLRFLASDGVSLFLLLIGGAAVYAELQTPGVGLGGMIAFICFLLYFWAKFFEGTATELEILLFVAGIGCLVLEIFVFPGTAIFGLGGGLMVIASLILASQTFIVPRNSYQLQQMEQSLLVIGGAALGTIVAIAGLRRWLPHAPVFNRMLLEPPSAEELQDLDYRESLVNYEHLLGRSGSAVTRLAPSGKAEIAGELVDVITDGDFIDRGTPVAVTEVLGNRVVVTRA